MAQPNRDQFVKQLQETAAARAIPIERLSCRNIPNKDGFELIVESGGKKRVFTVDDAGSINDKDAEIELIINQVRDNE